MSFFASSTAARKQPPHSFILKSTSIKHLPDSYGSQSQVLAGKIIAFEVCILWGLVLDCKMLLKPRENNHPPSCLIKIICQKVSNIMHHDFAAMMLVSRGDSVANFRWIGKNMMIQRVTCHSLQVHEPRENNHPIHSSWNLPQSSICLTVMAVSRKC